MKPTSRKGPLNCRSPFDFAPDEQAGLPVELDARRGNSRSLHFATPDFLWNLVASASFMRLSLLKGAHAALSSAAWQEIRVRSGRDDKFVFTTHLSGEGRVNCRSLGFARDDKGEGGAPIEGSGATDMSPDAVHSSLNLPQASQAAPNDTGRMAWIRHSPTQAKRRLEWATPGFS